LKADWAIEKVIARMSDAEWISDQDPPAGSCVGVRGAVVRDVKAELGVNGAEGLRDCDQIWRTTRTG
jgi:enamine deaminase RidA (YjgF/YER057c/UK114 family)